MMCIDVFFSAEHAVHSCLLMLCMF